MYIGWRLVSVGFGMAVVVSAFVAQAHTDHAPVGAGPGSLLSPAGTSTDLAARTGQAAAHMCDVIEQGKDCALLELADSAALDLLALQTQELEAQRHLHRALLERAIAPADWAEIEREQLALLDTAGRRYLRFLADASAVLDAEQKRRFAH